MCSQDFGFVHEVETMGRRGRERWRVAGKKASVEVGSRVPHVRTRTQLSQFLMGDHGHTGLWVCV